MSPQRANERDFYDPMPSLPGVPIWLWRRTPRWGRVAITAAGLAALGTMVALVLLGVAVGDRQRRAEERNRARIAEALRADQAPRNAALASTNPQEMEAALERVISADVEARFKARAPATSCRRIRPADDLGRVPVRASDRFFTCFSQVRRRGTAVGPLESGYHFLARADLLTRRLYWCKLNPRPIHADQEEFIRVPLSRLCVAVR